MQIFGLVSLKRWLPMNHRELPELLEIEFEAILPGRKQHDQRNKQHPIIRNFLDETVREWSVDGKRIWVVYVGNSKEPSHKNHEYGGFCVRRFACHLVENSKMCWNTYASEPQQRVRDFCSSLSELSEL